MGLIYEKIGIDQTLILAPREGYQRPFDFGTDWTEVRIGMYFSCIAASGDNTQNIDETVALAGAPDRLTYGLKDLTNDIPGVAGTNFIGLTEASAVSSGAANGAFGTGGGILSLAAGSAIGTAFSVNAAVNNQSLRSGAASASATGYCGVNVLKFVVNDSGLSTQTITVTGFNQNPISGDDYSAGALRTVMNNATYASLGAAFAWNDGAAALPLPNCFWIRVPFFNNRIRISAHRAIRYAPV